METQSQALLLTNDATPIPDLCAHIFGWTPAERISKLGGNAECHFDSTASAESLEVIVSMD